MEKHKMEELKTLKDFDFYRISWCKIDDELKKEGIKWVKNYRKKQWFDVANGFIDFFNIKEEDLK